jgi:hypothetical protein
VAQIPPKGELIEIPYEEMTSQQDRGGMGDGMYAFAGWAAEKYQRDGTHIPPALSALLAARDPRVVQGEFRIRPVPLESDPTKLAGWEVWLDNQGPATPSSGKSIGFIGTIVLTDEAGNGTKNAGLGLESMPTPGGGWSALQFLPFNGDYGAQLHGVRALPNTRIRLGVRGHSAFVNARLPSLEQGELKIPLASFTKTGAAHQSDWFDGAALGAKLGEKKARIGFFQGGKRVNDQLPDTIYTGEEAFIRAEFKDPPRVVVTRIDNGWKVEMRNQLPDNDAIGPLGFTGQLKVESGETLEGDNQGLPGFAFSKDQRATSWVIPLGFKIGAAVLADGGTLMVDTGALGWRGRVQLPGPGGVVDTDATRETRVATWSLRESDYLRAGLIPRDQG